MSTYADDIKRIAKDDEPKGGLGTAYLREAIPGNSETTADAKDERVMTIVSPVTVEILTYDDAQDVLVEANNGDFTIKTAATARIIDDNEQIIEIDEIIYADPDAPPQ